MGREPLDGARRGDKRHGARAGNVGQRLREIIEDKMGFEMPEIIALTRPTAKNRKRPQHWARQ
jgi:hypothetical protein